MERRAPRLQLRLEASTELRCPEFNYRRLLAAEESRLKAEKEKKKANQANGLLDNIFSDNDEDVERIAKQFEQKYGSSSTYGKTKGRCKQDDYADIGAGYDENDSFIDNTDGYDEIIPPECDTACGGFYINSGSLEFKNVTGAGLSTGEGGGGDSSPTPGHKKSHKRPLSSSESEEESSSSDDDSEESSVVEKSHETDVKGAKTISVTDSDKSGEDGKKPKAEKIKYPDPKDDLPRKKRKSSQEGSTSSGQETSNNKKVDEIPTEPRTNGVENNSSDSRSSDSSKPRVVPSSDNHASSDSSRDTVPAKAVVLPTPPPPIELPEGLSPEIFALINKLKTLTDKHFASRTGKISGTEVNDIILGLETQCKGGKVTSRFRHSIFAYAAQLLRRGKAGLLQRARRLAEDNQRTSALTSPIDRLKGMIEKMKPTLLEQYRVEAQKIKELNKQIVLQNTVLEDEKKIQERRLPKRRFPWNDQVRNVLQELMKSRGMDADSGEESAIRFLQTVVLPLFPTGFVRMPTLLQQVRSNKSPKSLNDSGKRLLNKSELKTTSGVNASAVAPPKPATKTGNDYKYTEFVDKHISDPESGISISRTKVKAPMSSICIGTDVDEHAETVKVADASSLLKSDRVLSVAIERMISNSPDSDKNDFFKVQTDKVTGTQTIANNVSISLTNVFPEKCDSEKTPPPKTVIIQPVPETLDNEKLLQHVKNSNEISITLNNPNTVIKSLESCNYENIPNMNYLKVKSASSLFDKNSKIKTPPSKSLTVDVVSKQSSGYNSDNSKVKSYVDSSKTVFNKPMAQDCSHLVKRKSVNVATPLSTVITSKPVKSLNDDYKSTVILGDFVKPPQKQDYPPANRYSTSPNSITNSVRSKYSEMNGNPQKDALQMLNISPNERNHSFAKPSSKPADLYSSRDNSSSHKHPRIVKNSDTYEVIVNLNRSQSDQKVNANDLSRIKKADRSSGPPLHLDDSSSDDCVEILTDEEISPKKLVASIRQMAEDNDKKNISEFKAMAVHKPKYQEARDRNINKLNYLANPSKDSWYPNVTKSSSNTLHNPIEYISKKFMKKMSYESDVKKLKRDDVVREKEPVSAKVSENVCDNLALNISSVRSESVSVIKDTIAIKSDRITDIVPEKKSGLSPFDISDKDLIMDQDDVNKVMQDLKELQNLQMPIDGIHQRLYDDPSNNICHTSSFSSETDSRLYDEHKDDRIKIMTSTMSKARACGMHTPRSTIRYSPQASKICLECDLIVNIKGSSSIFVEYTAPQNLTTGSLQ